MWKWIIGIVIVVVVLGGGGIVAVLASPVGAKLRGQQTEMGTEVAFTAAERGDLIRTVSAPGSIEPRTMVQISSQVSAEVLALPFREGDSVKAGDVVVRLDPQTLTAVLESAQAQLRSEQARLTGAEASLINARLSYERQTALYETGDVTKADLDAAEAGYLQAQSNKQVIEHSIEMAEARIDQAQEDLDNTVITSPMDGVVTALNTEVGETVIVGTTNNPGSIIMEIADLSEMLVEAQVDEANIAPVAEGQAVTVYINAYPDREFEGSVRRIGLKRQVATDGTGIFEVEILLKTEEGDRLYSGLTASVDIAVEEFFDVVKVPSQSVLDRRVDALPDGVKNGSDYIDTEKAFARVIYVMENGKSVARPVEVGPSDLTHTVITGGLDEGERVISGPYRVLVSIGHDQAVRDQDAEPEAAEPGETAVAGADAEGDDETNNDDADGSADADAEEVAEG